MSSSARKMRRQIRRGFNMSGITNEQADAAIKEMARLQNVQREEARALAPQISEKVFERVRKEWTPKIQAMMLMMFVAYLCDKRGYGKKRLHDFVIEFNDYADDLVRAGIRMEEIVEDLKKNAPHFDVEAAFRECEMRSKAADKEFRRVQDKIKKGGSWL